MKLYARELSLILVSSFALAPKASAESLSKATLVGTWDYTSYTMLEKGKASGTVQFKPHTMLFTYRANGTWTMEAADATHTRLDGHYEIRGDEIVLIKTDGALYQDFMVDVKNGGSLMVLKDKRSLITASKVETGQ